MIQLFRAAALAKKAEPGLCIDSASGVQEAWPAGMLAVQPLWPQQSCRVISAPCLEELHKLCTQAHPFLSCVLETKSGHVGAFAAG